MFNLTSSVPKSWQTVSRQADRVTNEATPVNGTTHLPPPRDLGGVLRERREAMGASLAEVETATRIRQKYLAALESDEWVLLPGEVVGRGFLRNYATYLGLDPTEAVDRRRSVADPLLSTSLAGTSAGSVLPPERDVDYRPKDVSLKDEPEGIQQRELRVGPFFTVVSVVGALLLFWWVTSNFSTEISAGVSNMIAAMQTRSADRQVAAGITPDANALATNPVVAGDNDENITTNTGIQEAPDAAAANEGTASNQPANPNPAQQVTPVQPVAALATEPVRATILIPTDTPAAPVADAPEQAASEAPVDVAQAPTEAPVNTPEPTALPTDTPIPPPTETPLPVPTNTPAPPPTEAPPPVVAASCADASMAFFAPGVNQVLSGAVAVTGRAVHDNLDYYKLEFAPGANAEGGYVYFDGNKAPVDGGTLGTFNTTALPNGAYTIQLTVVDLTGNYPTPCRTSIVIQN